MLYLVLSRDSIVRIIISPDDGGIFAVGTLESISLWKLVSILGWYLGVAVGLQLLDSVFVGIVLGGGIARIGSLLGDTE